MKIFIKLVTILVSIYGIVSCTPKMMIDFWNGHYSLRNTAEKMRKQEEEFYAKETEEQKKLRKKNIDYCLNWINKKYPNPNFDYDLSNKKQTLYKSCMRERGSSIL
ncbi:hypothetical protein EDC44_12830 [Cricetibacter osteomyelitidis]|uniref:Lipoprotein n=1 Tax=Cricetibacter osteomyelitidis TaxID=1521931 RepID=A0A4R2SPK1_9PAST|nr:hypothetical protein [Cricetibacter osteomyelitidis]TCP92077.1 hypothetical protein EDC44_12830 [Cricetibacter osteomyelitidis]